MEAPPTGCMGPSPQLQQQRALERVPVRMLLDPELIDCQDNRQHHINGQDPFPLDANAGSSSGN